MTERIDTVIVGGGQAGLALSHALSAVGREHVVLERGLAAQRWRSERWDSFRLLTPNWMTRLPGTRYAGADPDGFMNRGEIVDFFDAYAGGVPLRPGVFVREVRAAAVRTGRNSHGGWQVHTDAGMIQARQVVAATGYGIPQVPVVPGVLGLHSAAYRNPAELPRGAVLVVGAGPSGQQIADELAGHGRSVYLAVGGHRPLPRRHAGRDSYYWLDRLGYLDRTVDTLPGSRTDFRAHGPVLAGGERDLNLRRLAGNGVVPVGRLVGFDGRRAYFGNDLADNLAAADAHANRFIELVSERRNSADPLPPAQVPSESIPHWAIAPPMQLDLRNNGIRTIIWATGHPGTWPYLPKSVLDGNGRPIHRRGVTIAAGLFVLGLRWQHRRSSHLIDGVGQDALYLADRVAGTDRHGSLETRSLVRA